MAWDVPSFYIPVNPNQGGQIASYADRLLGAYDQGQASRRQQDVLDARRSIGGAGMTNPDGSPNYQSMAERLLGAGDIEGANTFMRLGQQQEDRAYRRSRDASEDAWRQQQFGFQQQQAAASNARADKGLTLQEQQFGFQRDQAAASNARADKGLQLQEQQAARAGVPAGYRSTPDGGVEPMPGGPQDFNASIERRKREALGAGLVQGSPEFTAYVLTGKVPTQRQNIPSGYEPGPNGTLVAIPGGPAEKIDAEVAARLGLTKSFLEQLPSIREGVDKGEATGIINGPMGAAGYGRPAELGRQVQSGVDALIRNLTGAGMSQSEAEKYAKRYEISWGDSQQTVSSKIQQLERELRSTAEVLGRGRGGAGFINDIPITYTDKDQARAQRGVQGGPAPAGAQSGAPVRVNTPEEAARLPRGTRFVTPDGREKVVP